MLFLADGEAIDDLIDTIKEGKKRLKDKHLKMLQKLEEQENK